MYYKYTFFHDKIEVEINCCIIRYICIVVMGRFYSGSINGKFWFGIQNSDDISRLVTITPEETYIWKVCLCNVDMHNITDYCNICYTTKKEHENAVIEEDEINEDNSLIIEAQELIYRLNKEDHYDELKESMNTLRTKIHPDITSEFDKLDQTDKILDAFTGVFDKCLNVLENIQNKANENGSPLPDGYSALVARYTIGYQIEYYLRTSNEDCCVYCEY